MAWPKSIGMRDFLAVTASDDGIEGVAFRRLQSVQRTSGPDVGRETGEVETIPGAA
jgi:hypothetical protein